eukprot:7287299-Lingulodinium_polyedra.AAC.1
MWDRESQVVLEFPPRGLRPPSAICAGFCPRPGGAGRGEDFRTLAGLPLAELQEAAARVSR